MILPVLLLCLVGFSFGCWPVDVHYQTTYCTSSAAVIVKITRERRSSESFVAELKYEGTLVKAVKGFDHVYPGSSLIVATPGPANSCGPRRLSIGSTYMIIGEERSSNEVSARVFNGARELSSDEEQRNVEKRVRSYDCRCEVTSDWMLGPGTGPQNNRPFECKVQGGECPWNEGACVLRGGSCTYVHKCT